MSDDAAHVDLGDITSMEQHQLMLAMPAKDGYCRFYGSYVSVGSDACFPDGNLHTCISTETFGPSIGQCQ